MANTKAKKGKSSSAKKKSHRLNAGKSLESVKPLTKVAAPAPSPHDTSLPTETITLNYSKIQVKYD
jgi:type VI protein secretion system component Hcp